MMGGPFYVTYSVFGVKNKYNNKHGEEDKSGEKNFSDGQTFLIDQITEQKKC